MKIEKISDVQIKFILNHSDLAERNIKMAELAYGSDKLTDLFHDMMEEAFNLYGFESGSSPLVIEAIPSAIDGIVVIVTKVSQQELTQDHFDLGKQNDLLSKIRKKIMDAKEEHQLLPPDPNLIIYSFDKLDDVSLVCARIYIDFDGDGALYKSNDKFYLVLEPNTPLEYIDAILSEYGEWQSPNIITKHFLIEHGEAIIGTNVLQIMAHI